MPQDLNIVTASSLAQGFPRESISHTATDSEALQTGAAGQSINLFKSPNNAATGVAKTLYQTNMKNPGTFDRPETMDVQRIGVGVWPANGVGATTVPTTAVALLISIVEDSNLIFTVGGSRKQYWNGPLHRIPAGMGLWTILGRGTEVALTLDSSANIGYPMAKAMFPLKYTIRIQWAEPFEWNIAVGHPMPASFAGLGTTPRIFGLLEGIKHRGIQ
jgi:hypothetical protein